MKLFYLVLLGLLGRALAMHVADDPGIHPAAFPTRQTITWFLWQICQTLFVTYLGYKVNFRLFINDKLKISLINCIGLGMSH